MAKKPKSESSLLIAAFIAEAKPIADRIASDRDKLRDLLSDYKSILESVEDAHDDFESVIETLSQYV